MLAPESFGKPVVVGVCCNVALLNPLQKAEQLGCIQVKLLDEARNPVEMESQQRQRDTRRSLGKCKHIKLPVMLSILQQHRLSKG